ncbi:hypothetical protein L7F22_051797 [Adiantum nelumboides]|nr:hypothetical protein [Adiantum nelumboides]
MDCLGNLDIHEFLAALGKTAIAKATQGISNSSSKQSKRSDIVFVEDTDEYSQLINCGLDDREDKGLSSAGGWKTRNNSYGSEAKKKDNLCTWKNTTHLKGNCGWGEKKEVAESGGWETSTSIEANSGWGKQSGSVAGWDKGTQQNCGDGWGEKQETFWGWRQGTDKDATFETGWVKEDKFCIWKKGCGKAPGLLEKSAREEGVQKGWAGSVGQGINNGWGEEKSASGKWERGSQEVATESGWGNSKPQYNDCGWGEGKNTASEVLTERSIQQPDNTGWGEGGTASGGGGMGAREKNTQEGWGGDICAGGYGEDKGTAGGLGKKKEASAPGGWEAEGKEDFTENGWESTAPQETAGGSGEAPSGWDGGNQQDEGVKDGWEGSINIGSGAGWGEDNGVSCGWGKHKEVSTFGDDKSASCGSEKKKEVASPSGWEREAKEESTQDGWESIRSREATGGWGKDKSAPNGWGRGIDRENGAKDGWESSSIHAIDSGWGKDKDEWGKKTEALASGETKRGSQVKPTRNGWESSTFGKDSGGWGEDKTVAGGWKSRLHQENNEAGRDNTGGWAKTKGFSDSGGWELGAHEGGIEIGWRSSVHGEIQEKGASGGWGKERKAMYGRWGEGTQKPAAGAWGWKKKFDPATRKNDAWKENTCSQWNPNTCDNGWGKRIEGTAGRWGQSSQQEVDDGWGKSSSKKADFHWAKGEDLSCSGWGEKKEGGDGWTKNTGEIIDDGWGKKQEVSPPGAWETGAQEKIDNGWGSSSKKIDCRRGEKRGVTHVLGDERGEWQEGMQEKDSTSGSGNEPNLTFGEWRPVDNVDSASRQKGTAYCTAGRDITEEKISELDKAKEGARSGWEQTLVQEVDVKWGQKTDNAWEKLPQNDTNLGWGQETDSAALSWKENCNTSSRWGEETMEQGPNMGGGNKISASGCEKGTQKTTQSKWETTTQEDGNAGWGDAKVKGALGGLEQNKRQVVDDGWGECAIENSTNSGWGSTLNTKVKVDKVPLYSEAAQPDTSPVYGLAGEQTVVMNDTSDWNYSSKQVISWEPCTKDPRNQHSRRSENLGADKRRTGTFGPSGSNAVPLGKRECISEGTKTSDWKQPPNCDGTSNQLNSQKTHQDEHRFCKSRNDRHASSARRDKMEEKASELDKAMQGAGAVWEQTTLQEVEDGWGEKADTGWEEAVQKDTDLGWGQKTDSAACSWKEKSDHPSRLEKTTMEQGFNMGLGNKNSACRWENETSKITHIGWESRTEEHSNCGWGEATAEGTSRGLKQNTHQAADDGWGECAVESNKNDGWNSTCDVKANNDKVPLYSEWTISDTSRVVEGSSGEQTFVTNDKSGWEPCTQELNTGNQHSGRSAVSWSENRDANKRQSGTFGPSGSNTVALGKRKGISEGSEIRDWKKLPNSDAALNQLNIQRSYQDGRCRFSKRYNNGYASSPWRDSASVCPPNNDRRSRLKAMISLPEYSEIDELYKTTNKILHYSGYQRGDRLNSDDERFVLENILAHHAEKEAKLGCGLDYLMIDSHADHQVNCFWVMRKDGSKTDFSYWKCLEHLLEGKYPHAAKDAHRELGKDGCVVTSNESLEAHVMDSKQEAKDFVAPLKEIQTEDNVNRQEEEIGW